MGNNKARACESLGFVHKKRLCQRFDTTSCFLRFKLVFIGKKLLLFGKQLHTIQMSDIANEQEQIFITAMRNDDFNPILELKMKGYQPSKNVLKSLQPDVSSTTFIAAAKIFQMEGVLKSIQDIKPAQSPITGGNKRIIELGN